MIRLLRGFCVAATIAGVSAGAAGQEQWLRYRTSTNPSEQVGSAYGQRARVVAKAPSALSLPDFAGRAPLFVRWKTPVVPDGVLWFALDRASPDEPPERLYVDTDLDGDLSDEKPVPADDVMDDRYQQSRFHAVKLRLPSEDGPVAYHLNLTYRDYQGKKNCYFQPAGWYEGPVTLGGKKLWCTLIDNNANGRFDDSGTHRSQSDRIRLAPKGDRSFQNYGGDTTTRAVGKFVEAGDALFALTIAPDGAFVCFSPVVEPPPRGTVQLARCVSAFSVFGPQGHFFREASDGAADVPAGEYMIDRYEVVRKDEAGATWKLRELGAGCEKPFRLEPGQTATLDLGEGVLCKLTASKSGDAYRINTSIETPRGDRLTLERNGTQPPAPQIRIANADKTYDKKFRLEYG